MSNHADNAERAVLGSMLRSNDCIADVVPVVRADDFRVDAHRLLWSAIVGLWDGGRPADLVTVADELKRRGRVEDVGGYGRLAELLDAAPTAANAVYYAQAVRDAAVLRDLERVGCEIIRDAQAPPGPVDEVLDAAEKRIFALAERGLVGTARPLSAVLRDSLTRIDGRRCSDASGLASGLSTGLRSLDYYTAGLHAGELVLAAARPGAGKTALGLALAHHAAAVEGRPVVFFSLEQADVELGERLLCSQAKVDGQHVRRGALEPEEAERLVGARDRMGDAPLYVLDLPGQRMLRIAAEARRVKARHGLGLVVLDYLQLVEPDNPRAPRHEQVGTISRRLKCLARELAVPVVALCQLNREPEGRAGGEPRLSDLRESGALEADADTVLLLHRPDAAGDQVQVHVAKQRNGPVGKVQLRFERRFLRFEDAGPDGGSPW